MKQCYPAFFAIVLGFLLPIGPVAAEDEVITIEGTRIRGNQELPTILYLLPWQAPEIQELPRPEQSFAIQTPLELIERQEFRRLIGYYEQFKSTGAGPARSKVKQDP